MKIRILFGAFLLSVACSRHQVKRSDNNGILPSPRSYDIAVSVETIGFKGSKPFPQMRAVIKEDFRNTFQGWAGLEENGFPDADQAEKLMNSLWESWPNKTTFPGDGPWLEKGDSRLVMWFDFKMKDKEYRAWSIVGDVLAGRPSHGVPMSSFDEVRLIWALILDDGRVAAVGQIKRSTVSDRKKFIRIAVGQIKKIAEFRLRHDVAVTVETS